MKRKPPLYRQGAGFKRSRAERWGLGGVVVSVLAFALAAAYAGGAQVAGHVANLPPSLIAGLLGLSMFNYATRAVRWHLFSRRIGLAVPWTVGGLYYMAGFAMAITPGKLGEVFRLWLLNRRYGYRYERTMSLLVGDRLSDAGIVSLLSLLGAGAFSGYLPAISIVAIGIISLTVIFLKPRLLIGLIGWTYGRVKRFPRGFGRLRMALRYIERLSSWPVYGGALVIVFLGWCAEVYAFFWLVNELGGTIGLDQAAFIFCFSLIVGAVVMLPGGLGGTEVGMAALLVLSGVELDVAIAAVAVIRVTTLWFSVMLGFMALPFATRHARGDR